MTLYEFKKLVKLNKLCGLYVLTGKETWVKAQYVKHIKSCYDLQKVTNISDIESLVGRKNLLGRCCNLLCYTETIQLVKLDKLNKLAKDSNSVVIIVSNDDSDCDYDNLAYFDILPSNIIKKHTASPYVKTRWQAENIKDSLAILNKTEDDIIECGLAVVELPKISYESYGLALVNGDIGKLVKYNYILCLQEETDIFMYLVTILDFIDIYKTFSITGDVFKRC